jgi:hypothetical protein
VAAACCLRWFPCSCDAVTDHEGFLAGRMLRQDRVLQQEMDLSGRAYVLCKITCVMLDK